MLLHRITDFILQGRIQAMATAFICVYLSLMLGGMTAAFLIGIVGIIIAAFVTLRKGVIDGAWVTVAASIPYFLSYSAQASGNNIWIVGIIAVVSSNLLTWIFAILLRQYGNWSLTLDCALLIGAVFVGVLHFVFPDISNWWASQMIAHVKKSAEALAELQAAQTQQESTKALIETFTESVNAIKPYITGFITVVFLFGALMPMLIARWWQSVIFNPGGLQKELYRIRLSYVSGSIFVIAIILTYLGNGVASDILPILFGIYCLAGLSLLHAFIGPTKYWWLWLGVIYLGLMFLPIVIIIIALMAVVDTSVDFRKRLHKF